MFDGDLVSNARQARRPALPFLGDRSPVGNWQASVELEKKNGAAGFSLCHQNKDGGPEARPAKPKIVSMRPVQQFLRKSLEVRLFGDRGKGLQVGLGLQGVFPGQAAGMVQGAVLA